MIDSESDMNVLLEHYSKNTAVHASPWIIAVQYETSCISSVFSVLEYTVVLTQHDVQLQYRTLQCISIISVLCTGVYSSADQHDAPLQYSKRLYSSWYSSVRYNTFLFPVLSVLEYTLLLTNMMYRFSTIQFIFSVFSVLEYTVVLTNMMYHSTAYLDFHHMHISIGEFNSLGWCS